MWIGFLLPALERILSHTPLELSVSLLICSSVPRSFLFTLSRFIRLFAFSDFTFLHYEMMKVDKRRDYIFFWLIIKNRKEKKVKSEVTQSCLTPCDPMDRSLLGSSVQGIFQARVLKWVAIPFSRGCSWPRNWTQVSRIVGRRFTLWVTRGSKEQESKAKRNSSSSLFLCESLRSP